MIKRKKWSEFRQAGLLLIINQLLHIFGWAIVLVLDDSTGEVTDAYPARVKFRGFDHKDQDEAYKNVSNFMKENADELHKEANEE